MDSLSQMKKILMRKQGLELSMVCIVHYMEQTLLLISVLMICIAANVVKQLVEFMKEKFVHFVGQK